MDAAEELPRREERKTMKGILIICSGNERGKLWRLENRLRQELGMEAQQQRLRITALPQEEKCICVHAGRRRRMLALSQILYLEKQLRKVIAVREQQESVSFYSRMEEVLSQLHCGFCHCHKSYVVNLQKVISLDSNGFHMADGALIPVGQRRQSAVYRQYDEFLTKKSPRGYRADEIFSCFEI